MPVLPEKFRYSANKRPFRGAANPVRKFQGLLSASAFLLSSILRAFSLFRRRSSRHDPGRNQCLLCGFQRAKPGHEGNAVIVGPSVTLRISHDKHGFARRLGVLDCGNLLFGQFQADRGRIREGVGWMWHGLKGTVFFRCFPAKKAK